MAKWYDNPKGKAEVGEHRDALPGGVARGRGAALNPGNRFETVRLHVLGEHLDEIARDNDGKPVKVPTRVIPDKTGKIINRVQTEIMGFDWTLNPYRGCEHGCVYCYARTYHEFLGFSSGIDFETKIMAKLDAPELLEKELASPSWKPERIMMSAITDCWQPIEEELRITRRCLEVLERCVQPVSMLTRSRRILRDTDLIASLAKRNAASVGVTMATLDSTLSSMMDPRASSPADRLRAMKDLSAAGVPVMVMVAPVIPGLTDHELPALLAEAAAAGATHAAYSILRLPYQNKELFFDWLSRRFPDRVSRVEAALHEIYNGKLYDSNISFFTRGKGNAAQQIASMFKLFVRRYNLDRPFNRFDASHFRRPMLGGQMALFD